jgi:alkanesulfonate monooxygenase SsuD/methylene tetrahydromethanopterin reductase-like flavin-dependent oxidoreductase (luciferase family)
VSAETTTDRSALRLGLTLPQRGALFGAFTIPELVETGHAVDETGLFDSLWIGDSLLANPRPEAIALLGALSSVTKTVDLAVGCLATLPVRDPVLLAAQWATLDQLSQGRMLLAVCLGIVKLDNASEREGALYGVTDASRVRRMEDNMEILRRLWTQDGASFEGRHLQFEDVTVLPKPVQDPPPIYIASQPNPELRAERALRRIARLADGWMTTRKRPTSIKNNVEAIREYLVEEGRDPSRFPVVGYHNVNLNPDREAAWEESFRFLGEYYGPVFTAEDTRHWTAAGTVDQVVADVLRLFEEGATEVTLRITAWDWRRQLEVLTHEVIPAIRAAA